MQNINVYKFIRTLNLSGLPLPRGKRASLIPIDLTVLSPDGSAQPALIATWIQPFKAAGLVHAITQQVRIRNCRSWQL